MDPLQPLSTKYYKVSARCCSFFVRLSNKHRTGRQSEEWTAEGQREAADAQASSPSYHFLAARRMGELRLHRYNIYCRGKVRTRTFNRGAKHTVWGPE